MSLYTSFNGQFLTVSLDISLQIRLVFVSGVGTDDLTPASVPGPQPESERRSVRAQTSNCDHFQDPETISRTLLMRCSVSSLQTILYCALCEHFVSENKNIKKN